eukprot:scaffold59602_cov69-Phaeocystis_antarctica.AAC.1
MTPTVWYRSSSEPADSFKPTWPLPVRAERLDDELVLGSALRFMALTAGRGALLRARRRARSVGKSGRVGACAEPGS